LHGDNLSELLSLAREAFHQNPALYGTLIFVFQTLGETFGEQGIPTTRYDQILHQMTKPLLDALDAQSAPSQQLLDKLNALHAALFTL
jgi:hypothetical protein